MNNKEEFVDKLKRAYEMEEAMSDTLIDLCGQQILGSGLSEPEQQRVRAILLSIKNDTEQHKQIVSDMITKIAQG